MSGAASDLAAPGNERPCVRADALVRRYGDEAVAWSPAAPTPVYLDPVAALIWQVLDGTVTLDELALDVHQVIGVPLAIARRRIDHVVTLFDQGGLLTSSEPPPAPHVGLGLFPAPPNP